MSLSKPPGIEALKLKSNLRDLIREDMIDTIYQIITGDSKDPKVLAIRRKLFGDPQ